MSQLDVEHVDLRELFRSVCFLMSGSSSKLVKLDGSLSADAPFFQAGLAGYSDAAMRIVARRHGCPFCVTEALLDRTLLGGGRGFAKADLGAVRICCTLGRRPSATRALMASPAKPSNSGGFCICTVPEGPTVFAKISV